MPRTKPRGILGISFGSIKLDENVSLPFPPETSPPADGRRAREKPRAQEAESEAPRRSGLPVYQRSGEGDGAGNDADAAHDTPADDSTDDDGAARKRQREALKAEKQARKKAEKERRKAEKQAQKEARRAAAAKAAEPAAEDAAEGEDLPGPPPESLRRPYAQLRKPVTARSGRKRPDPFPELNKPPELRRPRPGAFPELRKPDLEERLFGYRAPEDEEEGADDTTADSEVPRGKAGKGRAGRWLSGLFGRGPKADTEDAAAREAKGVDHPDADETGTLSGGVEAPAADEKDAVAEPCSEERAPPAGRETTAGTEEHISGDRLTEDGERAGSHAEEETAETGPASDEFVDGAEDGASRGGWLSGLLKSAQESAEKSAVPLSWLKDEKETPATAETPNPPETAEDTGAAETSITEETEAASGDDADQASLPETSGDAMAEAPLPGPEAEQAAGDAAPLTGRAEESGPSWEDESWRPDEDYRRRMAAALAQAALLGDQAESSGPPGEDAPPQDAASESAEPQAWDDDRQAGESSPEITSEGLSTGPIDAEPEGTGHPAPVETADDPAPARADPPAAAQETTPSVDGVAASEYAADAPDGDEAIPRPAPERTVRPARMSEAYKEELAERARRRAARATRRPVPPREQLELRLPEDEAAPDGNAAAARPQTEMPPPRKELRPEPGAPLTQKEGSRESQEARPDTDDRFEYAPAAGDEPPSGSVDGGDPDYGDVSAGAGDDADNRAAPDTTEPPAPPLPPGAPERPFAIAPASRTPARPIEEPAGPYGNEDEIRPEAPHTEEPAATQQAEEADNTSGEEPSARPYADLLDPGYKPKRGFMDLGRRSILFPDDDEEFGESEEEEGVAPPPTEDERYARARGPAPEKRQYGDMEDEAPSPHQPPPGNDRFVPPAWDEPAPGTPRGSGPHGVHAEEPVDPALPSGHGNASWNGGQEGDRPQARHGETNGHGAPAPAVEDEPHPPAPARREYADAWDDDASDDETPAFIAPEPTGRPEQAAEVMRTIAHSDTEYYLPPPKMPGMVLLGVGGALVGALLANFLYGMLGDVVIPRFMIILIGIQIFGGLGVFAGNAVIIPMGTRRRQAVQPVMRADYEEWPEEDWEDSEDHLDRGPVLNDPWEDDRDEPGVVPPAGRGARDVMRPPPPPQ